MAREKKGMVEKGIRAARAPKAQAAKPAKAMAPKAKALKAAAPKGVASLAMRRLATPPPHPMTAEQDRLEDEDGPFDDGVM